MIPSQIDEWFTSGLAGIRRARGSAGYRELVIDPRIAGDLTHVDGSYETPYGEVASEWTRSRGVFRLEIEVPPNTTAEVRVPTDGRKPDRSPKGATFVGIDGDRAVNTVPSGSYEFTARDARASPRPWLRRRQAVAGARFAISISQPASSGSWGTKRSSVASGATRSSTPRTSPLCRPQMTGWFSRTESR